jgi:Protein of unknown function (DUF2917)
MHEERPGRPIKHALYAYIKEPIMPFDFAPLRSGRQFLANRESLVLDDAEGAVITVESGSLWLTMENDTRDVVLAPGMRFEIDRSGRTIVAAEEDVRFRLLPPCACGEGIAAWIARKLGAGLDRSAPPGKSGSVPYY